MRTAALLGTAHNVDVNEKFGHKQFLCKSGKSPYHKTQMKKAGPRIQWWNTTFIVLSVRRIRILGPQWHDDSKRVVRAFPYIRGGHYITSQKAPSSISGAGEAWHGVCYECGSLTHSFEMPPPLWCCSSDWFHPHHDAPCPNTHKRSPKHVRSLSSRFHLSTSPLHPNRTQSAHGTGALRQRSSDAMNGGGHYPTYVFRCGGGQLWMWDVGCGRAMGGGTEGSRSELFMHLPHLPPPRARHCVYSPTLLPPPLNPTNTSPSTQCRDVP